MNLVVIRIHAFVVIPGLLALVMALLLRYGYKYQNNSDMTV